MTFISAPLLCPFAFDLFDNRSIPISAFHFNAFEHKLFCAAAQSKFFWSLPWRGVVIDILSYHAKMGHRNDLCHHFCIPLSFIFLHTLFDKAWYSLLLILIFLYLQDYQMRLHPPPFFRRRNEICSYLCRIAPTLVFLTLCKVPQFFEGIFYTHKEVLPFSSIKLGIFSSLAVTGITAKIILP